MQPAITNDRADIPAVAHVPPAADQIRLRADVTCYFLEREGVLFDAAAQRVYAANTSATFIWCCLEEGLAPQQVVYRLQAAFGIAREEAASYFESAIANWSSLGLILGVAGAEVPPPDQAAPDSVGELFAVSAPIVAERLYCLLDVIFQLGFSTEGLANEADAILAPLAAAEVARPHIRLDLIPHDGGYVIVKDGRRLCHCPYADQVVPLLKTCMVELALRESGDFAAVHAAAAGRDGRCVLLPGVSGSGKSTLTAALVAAGLQLLGDDTVVLDSENLAARPVPFGICVKDGAWRLLASRFPDLEDQPIHNRLDGKRVRYLVGADRRAWASPDARFEVRGIAFIRRIEGARALVPIPRSEALARLTTEFCLLADKLDEKKIAELVDWIRELECFELQYSDLEDGVALIKGLLG